MNYCTLTENEMQDIEDKHDEKLLQMFEDLKWTPAIGDLVREKHGFATVGIITEVHNKDITVHWQRQSPNNVSGTNHEVLHLRYLELIEKHQSSSSE